MHVRREPLISRVAELIAIHEPSSLPNNLPKGVCPKAVASTAAIAGKAPRWPSPEEVYELFLRYQGSTDELTASTLRYEVLPGLKAMTPTELRSKQVAILRILSKH